MAKPEKKLFVEQTPEGEYAVRQPGVKAPVAKAPTQEKAIDKARKLKPDQLLVERVRNTKIGGRDKWRKP